MNRKAFFSILSLILVSVLALNAWSAETPENAEPVKVENEGLSQISEAAPEVKEDLTSLNSLLTFSWLPSSELISSPATRWAGSCDELGSCQAPRAATKRKLVSQAVGLLLPA